MNKIPLSQGVYGDGSVTNSVGGLQLLVSSTPTSGVVGGIDRSVKSMPTVNWMNCWEPSIN
jgi:hypothetical protein